jgi:Resolvase, N terminal domain
VSNNQAVTVSFTVRGVTVPPADPPEAPGNLLVPEPAVRTGALIGYARVSTTGQLLDRQQHALAEAGCLRIFADKLSGKNADRPELAACLDYLRPGDTLVVPSLDRLSRSLVDLIAIVGTLRRRGVGFKSLHEALDTTTPGGRLVFHVFAALAEFDLIRERTLDGLRAAEAQGRRGGRRPAVDDDVLAVAPRPAVPRRVGHRHRTAPQDRPVDAVPGAATTRDRPCTGRRGAGPVRESITCRARLTRLAAAVARREPMLFVYPDLGAGARWEVTTARPRKWIA